MEIPENEGSINVRFDGGIASVLVPFFARPVWSVSPDGAVIAVVTTAIDGPDGGRYRVVLHDAADGSACSTASTRSPAFPSAERDRQRDRRQ